MKYSEAKKKIKDYLKRFCTTWRDFYDIRDEDDALFLATHIGPSDQLQDILMVSKQEEGWFEAKNLTGYEKKLADIFMELALTPLEEREEEKKYVVKIWDYEGGSFILVKVHGNGLLTISTTDTVDKRNRQDVEPLYQDGEPSYQFAFTKKEIDLLKDNVTLNIDWDKAVEEYDGEI